MRKVLAALGPLWLGGETGLGYESLRASRRPVPLHSRNTDFGAQGSAAEHAQRAVRSCGVGVVPPDRQGLCPVILQQKTIKVLAYC
jgi:hypothetical protein